MTFLPTINLEVLTELEVLLSLSAPLMAIGLQMSVAVGVLLEMIIAGPAAAQHSRPGGKQTKILEVLLTQVFVIHSLCLL